MTIETRPGVANDCDREHNSVLHATSCLPPQALSFAEIGFYPLPMRNQVPESLNADQLATAQTVQGQVKKTVEAPSNIEWRGSPNFSEGRRGQRVMAICDHIMDGTMASSDSWFKQTTFENSRVSAHFGVGRSGLIYQWVNTNSTAWANGWGVPPPKLYDSSLNWLQPVISGTINLNALTVSIEHEGQSGQSLTEPQYQSSFALHKYVVSKFNIMLDRQHIIGHYQINSDTRAGCPGNGFPWDRLLNDLKGFFEINSDQVVVVALKYKAMIITSATVRTGPSRTYPVVSSLQTVSNKVYDVSGEAHGEAVFAPSQPGGKDDVWVYIPELNGFVTRTVLKIM